MLSVSYRYRWIFLSVLCFHFTCISARSLEAYRHKTKEQYLRKPVGGGVANSHRRDTTTGQEEEVLEMAELFEDSCVILILLRPAGWI